MKNDAPRDTDLHELGELIGGIEVAMLTTRAEDGSLVSRPLQTLKLDAEGELIFFTAARSHKVAELTDDAEANLAYAHPGEHRYVSVRGRAHGSGRRHHRRAVDAFAESIFPRRARRSEPDGAAHPRA